MKNEYRIGLFFMFGVLVLVFIMDFLGEIPFNSNTKNIYTYFDSVGELKEGSPVKLKGFVIGKVSSVELDNRRLKVVMNVQKDAPVKNDSTASIQLSSLLGTSYINLTFGSDKGVLSNGSYPLPSVNPTELNKILTKLDSTIDSLGTALDGLSALSDNTDKISNIFTNLDTFTENLALGKGTLGKLVNDDSLYIQTSEASTKLNGILKKVNSGQGTLGKLVNDDSIYIQVSEASTELNDILKKVNSGQGTLGKLVNDDSLYHDARNTTLKIEKGVDTLEDLAPLGTIGSMLGVLTLL